jgi:hypothetical protein
VNRMARMVYSSRCVLVLAACLAGWGAAAAQYPVNVTIKGEITAVKPPDGFELDGHHVTIEPDTEFVSFYHTKKNGSQLRQDMEAGMWAEVVGTKDHSQPDVTATKITLRDDTERRVSGTGVIIRVIATGPETLLRADGYTLRVDQGTALKFAGGLTKLDEVSAGIWVHYEGTLSDQGEVHLNNAAFARLNLPKRKPDPSTEAQITTFPPGSFIDFDGSFRTDRGKHRMEDTGGCRWNPVVEDDAVQARVRRIGTSLIPKYQRGLPDDDPTRIPFRFYVVVERDARTDLDCHESQVLIPLEVIDRVQSDDQLAAVLADGIAENLQRQKERYWAGMDLLDLSKAASYVTLSLTGIVTTKTISHDVERRLEDDRGRVALGLMADAGYDPWQAPEAWRLLAPHDLPTNLAKLKYPPRSAYLKEILGLEYKKRTMGTQAAATGGRGGSAPDDKGGLK